MSDLRDLYQDVVLDHGRNPRNFRTMDQATAKVVGHNPLCGDKLVLYLKLEGDVVTDVSFEGAGCAISMASASLLSETTVGKTRAEIEETFAHFHEMLTGGVEHTVDTGALGKLAVFQGVCEYPTRVKCASLSWHTMKAALQGGEESITTE